MKYEIIIKKKIIKGSYSLFTFQCIFWLFFINVNIILFYCFLCVFAILIYKVVSYFIKLKLGKGIPLNYVTQNIVHIKTHIFKLINMKKDISDNKNP